MIVKNLLKFITIISIYLWCSIICAPGAISGKVYIPDGTEISVRYKLALTTELKEAPPQDGIFEVAADQNITGVKVFQEGNKVYCEMIQFKRPGSLGGGGVIEVRIDSIQTALGTNIQIEPTSLMSKGKNKKLKAILLLPALGYGFLIKGEHAELGRENETISLKTSGLITISY